ncbi:MAG TPA: asparagine synthase (glutamine-hydrolyzing) [Solirubrobacteraceae bacterium]|nr:asparagine synthase (glutamine-hydrolyzing) [Solirubrobacteraceae bacterium]
MCGFVGWVDFRRVLDDQWELVDTMTDTMRLRGPDDRGTWVEGHAAVGHRRLAVIDIERGRQPFVLSDPDGAWQTVLVFAGEIYNYRELRAELAGCGHGFQTNSDTEVIAVAHRQWGARCVERLNGMFAFGIWDAQKHELLLARDRLGVKPLYFHRYADGILFASEPKGILANPLFTPRVSEDSLVVLLNPRLTMKGETPVEDLREVKPGHTLLLGRDGAEERPYWRLMAQPHTDDWASTCHSVRDLLDDVVTRQLIADVPRAAMLSGGLDSTSVCALASRRLQVDAEAPLHTFSLEFASDELYFKPSPLRPEIDGPYARRAAAYIGSQHHSIVLRTDEVMGAMQSARTARDLPGLGQFDSSMYALFDAIRRSSTVALSGEAADEVFGGYPWFHEERLVWRDDFPWMGYTPRLTDCLSAELKSRIRPREQEQDRYRTLLSEVDHLPGEPKLDARMREVLYLSLQGPLAILLTRKDRMSMAVGLEVRVPFCDHRLVEYVWNIPWTMKSHEGQWKALLREAMRDVLPAETLQRRKSGYPGTHDPAYDAHTMRGVAACLNDPESPLAGLIDTVAVDRLLVEAEQSVTHLNGAHVLVSLAEADAWMRDYDITIV